MTRFLNSEDNEFTALGTAGSDAYIGLETFPNPGCAVVTYTSDEVVAHCPITGQPDFYTLSIQLRGTEKCLESKSLKIWLRQFADPDGPGLFCEALSVFIRNAIASAVDAEPDEVSIQLMQKSRGGISITSIV